MNEELPPADADKQYDRAITLVQYYVQLLWLVFSAFLLAETVLMGAIAAVAKDGPDAFVFGGALLGLFLIVPWWTSYRYNHALYTLRVHEARSFEPAAGGFFTSGRVLIQTGVAATDSSIRIPRLARILAPRHSISLLIWVFAAGFLVILVGYRPSKWRAADVPAATAPLSSSANDIPPSSPPPPQDKLNSP